MNKKTVLITGRRRDLAICNRQAGRCSVRLVRVLLPKETPQ